MLKKLLTLMTVLTAAVCFTQTGVASESHSVSKIENVKAQKGKKLSKIEKKQQFKKQNQKQNQKKNQKKNNKKNNNKNNNKGKK